MAQSNRLDDQTAYTTIDPAGMRTRLLGLAEQARRGWDLGGQALPRDSRRKPERVVIAGMGGSAIGGLLVKGIADATPGAVPVTVWRDYGLPAWVDERTLVVVVSISGGTVETRSAFKAAREKRAATLAITGPQELLGEARAAGVQALEIRYKGEPRAALGFTFVAPLRALQLLGALPDMSQQFSAAVATLEPLLRSLSTELPSEANFAKQLALELNGRLPVIYGARHLTAVAFRWKTQFNENADTWAFTEGMPEVNHNGVQGYGLPESLNGLPYVLVLDSPNFSGELRARLRLTAELMVEEKIRHRMIEIQAPGILGDILHGSLIGDMTAYYLAILTGRNPSKTAALTRLKDRTYATAAARGGI
ncbi:MAG: bifunctional phosphoglucose/phosphomannose isomerase [Chloroflexi bacterium]|nr:bifunctional phosphoglucose/phosphomannose isomerase [Chloroflexota bacterium]